jgi:hypothetical protein
MTYQIFHAFCLQNVWAVGEGHGATTPAYMVVLRVAALPEKARTRLAKRHARVRIGHFDLSHMMTDDKNYLTAQTLSSL